MMKNKTLTLVTSTLSLLALVGCASVKTNSEVAQTQSPDLTVSDLLVDRMVSQVAEEGKYLAEFVGSIVSKGITKEKALLTEIAAIAKANNLGVNASLSSANSLKSAFSKAEAARIMEVLGQQAKYAKFATSAEGKNLLSNAQTFAKESQGTVNSDVVAVDAATGKLQISTEIKGYAQNMTANVQDATLRNRLVKSIATVYNKTRGLLWANKKSCTIKYDNTALTNKAEIFDGLAEQATKVEGKARACQIKQLAIRMKDGLVKLHHQFENSVAKTLTQGEQTIKTLCEICNECPVNTPNVLMELRVANGGQYPAADAACAI